MPYSLPDQNIALCFRKYPGSIFPEYIKKMVTTDPIPNLDLLLIASLVAQGIEFWEPGRYKALRKKAHASCSQNRKFLQNYSHPQGYIGSVDHWPWALPLKWIQWCSLGYLLPEVTFA